MHKRFFFIFVALLVIGSAILLNQYAPVPVSNPQPAPLVATTSPDAIPQAVKTITITSDPDGVSIFLDDQNMGKTPLTLAQLNHNSYSLRAEKDGFVTEISTLLPQASNGLVHLTLPLKTSSSPDIVTNSAGVDNTGNIDDLLNNDPQIPGELVGKVTVPEGYRFPIETTDLTQRINLEVIPPNPNVPLTGLARSTLISRLANLYYYDPTTISILLDASFTPPSIALFTGDAYDPVNSKINHGESIVWYNASSTTCQLRTDPQSPMKINQLLPAYKALPMNFATAGIYIFYCQGTPGPTHTLVVS